MASFFDDPDDYSSEESADAPKKPLALRIIGLVLKIFFWGLIILMNGVIFWRLFSSGDPAETKLVKADDKLREAYSAYISATHEPGDYFAIYQSENTRMNITDEDPDEETGYLGNYGYFAVSNQILFPTAGQVQITFRYNLSTLEHLKEDYELPETPDPDADWYEVTLRVIKKDGTEQRLKPATSEKASKTRYRYYCMTFTGLPSFEDISEIYVDIYYDGDVDYTRRPYGDLCVYNSGYENREYKLSKKDISALTK